MPSKKYYLLWLPFYVAARKMQQIQFTDHEDAILKEMQSEKVVDIARRLNSKTVQHVERRCVALGLRCGSDAQVPDAVPAWKQKRSRK